MADKLDELGGLEAAKDYARCVGAGSPAQVMLDALIERLEKGEK